MNLILYGLPMSGKTTFGRNLSAHLNKAFLDTDHLIQDAYFQKTGTHASCREIFQKEGSIFFRKLESEAVLSLESVRDAVIAVGGGTLIEPENVNHLKKHGKLVYLEAEPEVLWERTAVCGIPAYLDPANAKSDFYRIMKERSVYYASIADIVLKSLDDDVGDRFGK